MTLLLTAVLLAPWPAAALPTARSLSGGVLSVAATGSALGSGPDGPRPSPDTPSRVGSTDDRPEAQAPLQARLARWPGWRLPAPLPRPGAQAPPWPRWFEGDWLVHSVAIDPQTGEAGREDPPWQARFVRDRHGAVVADRAFNAQALGRALLGERLLAVRDDPHHPQRQLARLQGGQLLETTLVGARQSSPASDLFLNDELSLEVLHGPGDPQVSRVESLGRWRLQSDGRIAGEQWQARYASPEQGLMAAAQTTWRVRLILDPRPPGSDPAT